MILAMRGIRKIFAVGVASLLLTLTSCFPLSFALSRAPRTHRATSGSNKHLSVKQKQSHLLLATTRMPRSDGAENSLLIDEDETREFCRSFLMPYGNARSFKVMARNKYAGGQLSRNRFQVERHTLNFHASSSSSRQMEDELIRCIHRTEVLAAAEMYRDGNDLPIVADWMGCYVSAYPLDVEDACDAFIALILKHRTERRRALVNQKGKEVHEELLLPALQQPVSKFESLLQQSSNLQHRLLKLDIDTKDPELIRSLHLAMRDCKCALAVETRGGFHVVIERGPSMQELWKFARDVNKDVPTEKQWITLEESCGCLVAVPGTKQGGFTARLKTDEWREALGDKRG